jgi:glycosyltransferase involved in cell wall biosynthesis
MHILHLPSWYSTSDKPWRGMFVRDQALALSAAGVQVGVAFVERRSLSRFNGLNLAVSHFQTEAGDEGDVPTIRMKGWSTFAQTVTGSLLWSRLMRRLVESYALVYGVPDLIHGHAALWGGYAAMLASRALQRPFVVTEHSSSVMTAGLSSEQQQHAADVYRRAAAVIAVSRNLKTSVDTVAGTSVAEVVPNTVDCDYFTLPPPRRKGAPFTLLAVCDLVSYKRVDLLIRAFARLNVRHPNTRLVIAGAGKDGRRLHALARAFVPQSKIEFTGALPRWQVRQWMREAGALVLCSDHETFGVVLIEAMATGIPVIATRSGGPEDIVTPDIGLLVDCDDSDALLRGMTEVLRRRFDPAAIRENVRRRFGYPVIANRLRAVYERLLGHSHQEVA